MAKKNCTTTSIVEQSDITPVTETEADVDAISPRILQLIAHFNKALKDDWLEAHPAIVEKIFRMLPPITVQSKQRTYAIKRLEGFEYQRSLSTGEPVKSITEEQIRAEMERYEKTSNKTINTTTKAV